MELALLIFVTAVFVYGMLFGIETCKVHINTLKKEKSKFYQKFLPKHLKSIYRNDILYLTKEKGVQDEKARKI